MTEVKVLRIGAHTAALNVDPAATQDTASMFVQRQIFQTPFELPPGGEEVVPVLFERLEDLHNDHKTYRGKVITGAKFSDGSTMEPADLFDSLQQITMIRESAEVSLDGDAILFSLYQPDSGFQMSLSHGSCAVCRREGETILGTGPFQLASDITANQVRLTRNPHYPKELALDEILFTVYPVDSDGRPTALLEAVEKGEVDLTSDLARDDVRRISGVRKSFQPGNATALLFLNNESPALGDARVRRGLAHCIDRVKAAECCYSNPLAFAAGSLLPRGLATASDGLGHNPRKAEELFSEAGKPERLNMLVVWGPRPYIARPQAVSEFLVEQYAAMGITVTPRIAADSGEFVRALREEQYDLILGGWTADTPDPWNFLDSVLHSDRIPGPSNLAVSANNGRLRSQAMDDALGRYRSERTDAELQAVLELVDVEAPLVPLIYGSISTVSSFQVTNLMPSEMPIFSVAELDLQTRWA